MTQDKRDWQKDMEMCKAASQGPWYSGVIGKEPMAVWYNIIGGPKLITVADHIQAHADARFTAESRTALPYWLQESAAEKARADAAEAREQRLKDAIETITCDVLPWGDANNATEKAINQFKNLLSTLYPEQRQPKAIEPTAIPSVSGGRSGFDTKEGE